MEQNFSIRPTAAHANSILNFWFVKTKPYQWFRRDKIFDQNVRDRFGALHGAACNGRCDVWRAHPVYALALIILLDQFSRNIYRDDARAFAQDGLALDVAREALRRRFDQLHGAKERAFFYMPFMHSEDLIVQEESVALFKARLPKSNNVDYAIEHCAILRQFGRFPHRNKCLGRHPTPGEIAFLKAGGFNP